MSESLQSGSELAHYRIVAAIGAGGMGEVYEALDRKLQRAIALKILPPHLVSNEDRVRRFKQEARSASGLNHPHIITIHDIGEARLSTAEESDLTIHFIAMELVLGKSLRERMREEGHELQNIVRWMSQAAEGLAKAHSAGIVHRDLKPDNIMISADGYAKVLDFGLAKLTQRPDNDTGDATQVRHETGEGMILGTAAYMSPEQVKGKTVDHRSDIFSFGCILYEAATGELPFRGSTKVDLMHNILHQRQAPVHELNPHVPGGLRKLIRRCLAKDPEKRYQSMKDLAIELAELHEEWDQLADDSAITSAGSREAAELSGRRPRVLFAIAAAAVAVVAAALMFWMTRRDRAPATPPAMKFTALSRTAGIEAFPTISPDGNYVVYQALSGGDRDLHLIRIGGRNAINLTESSPVDDAQPAFSPDGQTIAFRSERDGGGIFLMGATGESVRRLTDTGFYPAWSPDGKEIVFCTDNTTQAHGRNHPSELWVVNVATREKRKLHDGDAMHPKWSRDGKRIAFWGLPNYSAGQRDIATIPATGGKAEWLTNDAQLDWWPVWGPDSRTIYFASDRGGSLNLWTIGVDADGKAKGAPRPLTTPASLMSEFDLSNDGTKIVFVSWEGSSNLARIKVDPESLMATGQIEYITRGGEVLIDPQVSPDGEWIVSRTTLGRDDVVVMKTDGSQVRQVTDEFRNRGASWTADGSRIVMYSTRSGRYEFWSIRPDGSGAQQLTSTTKATSLWLPRPSPDGKKMSGFNESGSFIVDLSGVLPATRLEPLPLLPGGRMFIGTDWSSDGKEILGVRADSGAVKFDAVMVWSIEKRTYTTLIEIPGLAAHACFVPGERRVIYGTDSAIFVFNPVSAKSHLVARFEAKTRRPTMPRDRSAIYFAIQREETDLWMGTTGK